jgi:hypothetical protein
MSEAINELRRSSGPDEGGLRHALRDDIRDDISMQSEEGREWSSICTLASSWRNSEELDVTAPARISECPPMSVCTHIHIHTHARTFTFTVTMRGPWSLAGIHAQGS